MIRRTTTSHRLMAILLGTALTAAACGGAKSEESGLKVGVIVPLTGEGATQGPDMRDAIKLAADDFGDVNGGKIVVKTVDSAGDGAKALSAAQKLTQSEKVSMLMGGTYSAEILALVPQAKRLDVPIVTSNAQAVAVTGESCSEYVFRTGPNDAMNAAGNQQLIESDKELASKTWNIAVHDNLWGNGNLDIFKKIPNIKVGTTVKRAGETTDWSTALTKLRGSGNWGIYLALISGPGLAAFVKQARAAGIDEDILPPVGTPDSLLAQLGQAGVGLKSGAIYGSWTQESDNPKMKDFVTAYTKRFKRVPSPQAIQAYQAAYWAFESADKAKSTDSKKLIASMEKTRVDSILGDFGVRASDHQGEVSLFTGEVVKLDQKTHGASYAWKVSDEIPWSKLAASTPDTACKR